MRWLRNCSFIYRRENKLWPMPHQDCATRTLKCLSALYEKKEDKYGEKFNFDRR